MSASVTAEDPVQAMQHWLTEERSGPLKPLRVDVTRGEDADERDAWYFYLILPDPAGETWDTEQFARLQREFRDKALSVGLPYPWYVIPRTASRENLVLEDDRDPPDEQ